MDNNKSTKKQKSDVDDDTTIRHVFINIFFIEGIISLMCTTFNDFQMNVMKITTTANNNESMYIPAELVLLIATQKSCRGLGS